MGWAVKLQTSGGGSGGLAPGKTLDNLDCLGLHFARFHT